LPPLLAYLASLDSLRNELAAFLTGLDRQGPLAEPAKELAEAHKLFAKDVRRFESMANEAPAQWEKTPDTSKALGKLVEGFAAMGEASRDLVKQTDLVFKLASRLVETCEKECGAKENAAWSARDVNRARKALDEARQLAVEALRQVRYFWRHAHWLVERFPDARLRDVEGLVKLVDRAELKANDWSLTPGRYVGVAPEEEDKDFDFEEALREIHVELEDLNEEAAMLAATVKRNFEELGI
jgi:type I restriction enzyme M protein